MKLLLVYPKSNTLGNSKEVSMIEPLALEYLATGVSERHETRILDLRISNSLSSTISTWKPDVVGITGFTLHVPEMLSIAQEVKTIAQDIKVIVGGHHATFLPESFLVPSVDIIARWQCEGIIEQILNSIHSESELAKVPGLFCQFKTGWVRNDARPPSVFADMIPAHHLVKQYAHKYHLFQIRCSAMQMSRGCTYRCTFCDAHKFFQGRWSCRNLESVAKELPSLSSPLILIADENIGINTVFLSGILDLLVKREIKKKYFIQMGANEILRNRVVLDRWFELGLTAGLIGLERINDKGIKDFGKKTSVNINDSAISYWHSRGGIVIGSFIILPTDKEEDFKRLEDYIHTRNIDVPFLCILTPLPGTDTWEQYYAQLDYDFSKYDFLHSVIPTTMREAEFYRHFYHLYTSLNARRLVWRMVQNFGIGSWLLRTPTAYKALKKLRES